MNKTKAIVFSAIFTLVIYAFGYTIYRQANLPIVQFSASSDGDCANVVSSNEFLSCENLPTSYVSEWIE